VDRQTKWYLETIDLVTECKSCGNEVLFTLDDEILVFVGKCDDCGEIMTITVKE
jgi:hypothetical protein